eukprot:Em0018g360a
MLNLFCQLNWTGPKETVTAVPFLTEEQQAQWNKEALQKLSYDGESPYQLTEQPFLLYLTHCVLVEGRAILGPRSAHLAVRCLFTEQKLFEGCSNSLWNMISQLVEEDIPIFLREGALSEEKLCEFHLEMGHIFLYYYSWEQAERHFKAARSCAHISVEITGAMGKRTRFQERDLAQLVLKVDSGLSANVAQSCASILPRNVAHGDDVLYEKIQFSDLAASGVMVTPLQQAVILSECAYFQRSNPVHRLSSEEAESYVSYVLGEPRCWSVEYQALVVRSRLERQQHRKVERCMLQLQALVDSYSSPLPSATDRLTLFYCLVIPSCWEVQKDLASTMFGLGAAQGALEIYERLEMWEEVAICYQAAGRRGKAEEVIREQLQIQRTPLMLCLLGDVTQNPEHYKEAWELANHRSARAQKSLGMWYLKQQKYKECAESLQLSLGVNALQDGVWFCLGHAASKLGDYDLAVKALQHCVSIEPDNAEAWNNLAAQFVYKKDKIRASHAYKEAIKCNYESWKIWENYIMVSLDIGDFEEVIKSYHRLLDLKEKFCDSEVLQHLVPAVLKGVTDRGGVSAARLHKQLGLLLGRITSQTTCTAEIWELCAQYHLTSESADIRGKGLLELQKAQRMARLDSSWEKDIKKLQKVADYTMAYCQACRGLLDKFSKKEACQNLSSAKLALQSVIIKAKEFGLIATTEVEKMVEDLEREMQSILDLQQTYAIV